MRRALVIAGVMFAGLLAAAPVLATTKEAPLPEEEIVGLEEEVTFTLRVEGFSVNVFAEGDAGDQTATLSISRGGLTTAYRVPATITDDTLAARFGSLGEVKVHFAPSPKCRGYPAFTGSFTFTGEDEYVRVDAGSAGGVGAFVACSDEELEEGGIVAAGDEVHLGAVAGAFKRGSGRRVTVDEYEEFDGRPDIYISAFRIEKAEGMRISRGATLRAGRDSFHHNVKAGTATLRPPAPFTGWGRLTPRRGGKRTWEGNLRVPTLSGNPIELTGPAFRARFVKEGAFDE